jgi:hypothetical protein
MASVGALPMAGLQLPGAPVVLEPSEQLEADCQDQLQCYDCAWLSLTALSTVTCNLWL